MGEEDGTLGSWSISMAMSSMRENLCKEFGKFEDVLNTREDKLRREIEVLKQEKQSFKDMYDSERLDKEKVRKVLKRYKRERNEFSDQVARLSKENMVLRRVLGGKDDVIVNLLENYTKDKLISHVGALDLAVSAKLNSWAGDYEVLSNSGSVRRGGVCEGNEKQKNVERTEEKASNVDGRQEDAELGNGLNCLQSEGTRQHPAANVVMIVDDSDDGGVSSGMPKRKETTSCRSTDTKTLKRKRASDQSAGNCLDEVNVDSNACSSGKDKQTTCETEKALIIGFSMGNSGFDSDSPDPSDSDSSDDGDGIENIDLNLYTCKD